MEKLKGYILPVHACDVVYSVLFGLMCVLSRHVVNEPSDRSTVLTTYMTELELVDIPILLVCSVLVYAVLNMIPVFIKWVQKNSKPASLMKIRPVYLWIIIFTIIMVCWIPYMMSYWPGGIYNDTLDSIHIALGKQEWSNQNTVLYALWWKLIFWLGQIVNQGEYGGLKLMTIVQPAIMAGVGATFFTWLRRRGSKFVTIMLGVVAYALFPIFPYNAVSMWKDTLFSVNVFLYTWIIFLIVDEVDNEHKISIKNIALYTITSLLVIFGRNNGLYVFLVVTVSIIFVLRKKLEKKNWIGLVKASAIVCIASLIIQGPVYNLCGVEKSAPVEKYGIPLQQIGYIISSSGELDGDSRAVLEGILTVDGWINLYSPTVVDTIKFDPLFNRGYFDTHTGEFVVAYAKTIVKNPALAVKGYLLATIGFWDAFKSNSSAYICTAHCWNAEYFMSDYFNLSTGMYLSDIVGPRWYISAGLLAWIVHGTMIILKKSNKKEKMLVVLPTLVLWLTIMVATPLAFSFRYALALLMCVPFFIDVIIESYK